jgi:ribosome-binding factor A
MVSKTRADRIGRRIQEELSELLIFSVTDPRLQGVYLTDVKVDSELSFASVFVSALDSERKDEILEGFNSAAGFLRSRLAQRIDLRTVPQLRFNWDPTPENAERIERLIASLHDEAESDPDDTDA